MEQSIKGQVMARMMDANEAMQGIIDLLAKETPPEVYDSHSILFNMAESEDGQNVIILVYVMNNVTKKAAGYFYIPLVEFLEMNEAEFVADTMAQYIMNKKPEKVIFEA